ncbi:MAG: acyl-CoA thioesterase [Gammaproteobacteria bacterium]
MVDSLWQSEVRDYEVDFQGIVNNAVYFQYFSQARAHFLKELGVNLIECAKSGINIVLMKTEISYKKSLTFGDQFYVKSTIKRQSHFKFIITQALYKNNSPQVITESSNLICCINQKTNKPCVIDALNRFKIANELTS